MKSKIARLVCILLCFVTVLSFPGCGNTEPETTQSENTEPAVKTYDFFATDSKYVIIRSEDADSQTLTEFVRFKKAVASSGTTLELNDDWLAADQQPGELEILFGDTNRPESTEVLSKLESTAGYVICVMNGKLVINATTTKALGNAVTYMIDNVIGKDVEFTDDFVVTGEETVDIPSVVINGVALKDYTIAVANTSTWELPVYTLTRFFKKYCGITLKTVTTASAEEGSHLIIVGGTKADGTAYGQFETEIYYKDGNLHLGARNWTFGEKAIYTLIDQYFKKGSVEINLPEGTSQFYCSDAVNWDEADPSDLLTIQDRIVRSCYKLQSLLEYDKSQGIYFTYANQDYKATVKEARATGNRNTNCVILGNWAMKDAGFYTSGIYNHTYDGTFGYSFSGGSKEFFTKYFDVIDIRDEGKYIPELYNSGRLLDGDVIGFKGHNQTILPIGYAMDGGHSFCLESGQGARFNSFIGKNPSKSSVVGFIIRAKDAD